VTDAAVAWVASDTVIRPLDVWYVIMVLTLLVIVTDTLSWNWNVLRNAVCGKEAF
jgi:uncharacterized membrane protein YcaP (DUF421 family)